MTRNASTAVGSGMNVTAFLVIGSFRWLDKTVPISLSPAPERTTYRYGEEDDRHQGEPKHA